MSGPHRSDGRHRLARPRPGGHVSPARQAAFAVLLAVEQDEAYANVALQQALREGAWSARDKALCTGLVYGTLQRQRSLDALIAPWTSRPLGELTPAVRVLLRMAVYQLTFLDRVPAYAAIHEAVELCKSVQPQAAGFVNGVLRSFARAPSPPCERLRALADKAADEAEAWGIWYSYPTWLVTRWRAAFGPARCERMLAACNEEAGLSLRVNPLRASVDAVVAALAAQGVHAEPSPVSPAGVRVADGFAVENAAVYRDGWVTPQDEAAMLVAPLVRPAEHRRILDMCAAPGTKTTHLAELQADGGDIEACDIHPHKLRLLHGALRRLGIGSVRTRMMDARLLPDLPGMREAFDAVLLDAPCSGFGVLRHRPDIRWRRTPDDVTRLARLQRELLLAAVRLVRPGGVIVYSTCTLLPEENEEVVTAALSAAAGAVVAEDIRDELPPRPRAEAVDAPPGLYILPDALGTDGFFIARLRKVRAG
ncbi:ribosomal RNA small subunit methyltransferase B [Alicyclobacillus cellulosilyticus]|uniref:16S rRNA (cytosine(967)-C(5))-methyltransferase n=1 Tax=Alicyclobacillus cellulosilyticus TaxID=1003997 RepID=A0A917KCE0_9BACL|nr:16S rRNA (cytosine(967)-C(5))-methyltransferase RsmB [Alicyclobacillus cellulosilyticus]GGJ08190.1 ribosomal RNA small subunit methyltransferase B [Alicyclobacillus cellulosilyticus]